MTARGSAGPGGRWRRRNRRRRWRRRRRRDPARRASSSPRAPPQARRAPRPARPAGRGSSRSTISGSTEEVDETGDSFDANAALKARFYAQISGLPTLADDSGIEVDALAAGRASGRAATRAKTRGMPTTTRSSSPRSKAFRPRGAAPGTVARSRWRSRPASDPGAGSRDRDPRHARGPDRARPRGAGGFGYDPIFEPEAEAPGGRTLGEGAPRRRTPSRTARARRGGWPGS